MNFNNHKVNGDLETLIAEALSMMEHIYLQVIILDHHFI